MADQVSQHVVAVIGLGYVGLSVAAALASRGARVIGIERRGELVDAINRGICPFKEPEMDRLVRDAVSSGRLAAHTEPCLVKEAGTVILAVGTPLDAGCNPDMSQVYGAIDVIAGHLRKGQVLIIKSTVPPGVTRAVAIYLSLKSAVVPGRELAVACCPERLAEGRIVRDIETLPVLVGGLDRESGERAAAFWTDMGWDTIILSGPEEAEMCKMADNLWIDLNIALANELCMICHRLNVDVMEVIAAANTLTKGSGKVNILSPGPGVGGSCLVKDPWFLHRLGLEKGVHTNLPAAGRRANESMPGFMVEVLRESLTGAGIDLAGSRVCVLGLAFKQNTGDTRFTPTLPLVNLLVGGGAAVRVHDPWVDTQEAEELLGGLAEIKDSLEEAAAGCQALVFMVAHPEFIRSPEYWRDLVGEKCLLMDCRYLFEASAMTGAGLFYVAPGRRSTAGKGCGGVE